LHTPSASDQGLKPNSKAAQTAKRKVDTASHFILRAAYCKTEDLRRWFLAQETFLFKYQLEKLADSDSSSQGLALKTFLTQNKLHFNPVSEEEKQQVTPQLLSIVTPHSKDKVPSLADVTNTTYYKIPFQEATDLIASRQCFVKSGFAYVPMKRIVTIITAKFRVALSKSLAHASRVFASVTADFTPIAPLLNSMNSQYTGKEYSDNTQSMGGEYELTSQNINEYSSSMPLCMRNLHNGLTDDHKLKHHGRLQYGLFLKGAGMTMEESLVFFQREFTKIMTSEKFQKEYTYNIRHMYGKEGKRTNYTPYSCTKIIMGTPPNSGEHHGCPYRHFDDGHLSSILGKMQIGTSADRNEILSLKKKKHYNLACQKHFEVTHPDAAKVKDINLGGVGDHPNAWYAASVAYRVAKSGEVDTKMETTSPVKGAHNTTAKIITPQKL
jgi:DNA primase large subunit